MIEQFRQIAHFARQIARILEEVEPIKNRWFKPHPYADH